MNYNKYCIDVSNIYKKGLEFVINYIKEIALENSVDISGLEFSIRDNDFSYEYAGGGKFVIISFNPNCVYLDGKSFQIEIGAIELFKIDYSEKRVIDNIIESVYKL